MKLTEDEKGQSATYDYFTLKVLSRKAIIEYSPSSMFVILHSKNICMVHELTRNIYWHCHECPYFVFI